MSISVCVKWGKESFDVALDVNAPVSAFKQTIFERTGVPSEKQKRM